MKPCANCGRAFDEAAFPLGRPRKDGSRHPMRYCDGCLALPTRVGGGRTARLIAKREYRARVAA